MVKSSARGRYAPATASAAPAPTAVSHTAAPAPTPGNLAKGSKGEPVERLQTRLQELGYYTGAIDGDFGGGTQRAVEVFQRQNGLDADGIAGQKTLAALYSDAAPTADALSAMTNPAPIGLPEGPRVDDSYFTDTVFVGDSVTIKLEWYVTQKRKNGAEYALVFSVHRWNGDSSNTIEYNSYAQLKAWFDFHC